MATERKGSISERMEGKWYEIGRKPNLEQVGCKDSTEEYTFNKEKDKMSVMKTCITNNNRVIKRFGNVVSHLDSSKRKIEFSRILPAKRHWILNMDPENQWVVVGDPCRKEAWILSRKTHLSPEILERNLAFLESERFGVYDMIFRGETAFRHTN